LIVAKENDDEKVKQRSQSWPKLIVRRDNPGGDEIGWNIGAIELDIARTAAAEIH
jgi:hypothetical protein